jgi:transcription elongation factor GreA
MKKYPMTPIGKQALADEITRLKTIDRPSVIKAIAEAREHGDLKENAEYHAAREQQGFIEGRIKDIDTKLSLCQVIDVLTISNQGKIIFGSTIDLINTDDDNPVRYQIVGEDEADVNVGKLSVSSPIARALIGKEEGDIVSIQVPSGLMEYEIDSIHYV